jgi:DNA polymerase-1
MFDTMKDKKITAPEVVEKFGVLPDKVVEVQALSGDSVDNVPGVPGIGIKTAAQLITDFGDLETLLARAGEIPQPKRREALIEHADKARISKKLVLLETRVPLNVPLDDIGVHDPDPKLLVAFLKAMEFNSLTRRVADIYEMDASLIEADPRLAAPGAETGWHGTSPAQAAPSDTQASTSAPNAAPATSEASPRHLAAARAAEAVATKIDTAHYERVTTL